MALPFLYLPKRRDSVDRAIWTVRLGSHLRQILEMQTILSQNVMGHKQNLSLLFFSFTFYRGPAGPSRRLEPVMQTVSVVFSTLHCEGYTADLKYIACSLLFGVFAGSSKSYPPFWKAREDSQEKDCSFLGNDTFPNLYDALIYERKLKSEYLRRQIYERLLKREPSIVKLIENRSDLSKLSTLSEPSVYIPS